MAKNIKKFESYIDDVGSLREFDYVTSLERIFTKNEDALSTHDITVLDDEEDGWILTNIADDMYRISERGEGFVVEFTTADGVKEDYVLEAESEIMPDVVRSMFRADKNVAPIDLLQYKFDKDSYPSENEEVFDEIIEKKSKNSIVGTVSLTTPEASIKQNKGYNFNPTPGHKDTNPWYANVISKRIEINNTEPVKSFREWSGKFWRRKGQENLKYEPNSGVSQKEKVKSLK